MSVFFVSVLAALALSGCIYSNIHAPRAYRTATPGDIAASPADETLTGEACSHSILFLVAWGDSGYAAASRKTLGDRKDLILYDVKTDLKVRAYLFGLYARACTVMTGRAGKAKP